MFVPCKITTKDNRARISLGITQRPVYYVFMLLLIGIPNELLCVYVQYVNAVENSLLPCSHKASLLQLEAREDAGG